VGEDVTIEVTDRLVSQPLVRTSLDVMARAGIEVEAAADLLRFHVVAGQAYQAGEYTVNGDYPSSAAILAAGVLTGGDLVIERLYDDCQGERAIVELLQRMGADVHWDGQRVRLRPGGALRGADFDGDQATDAVLAMLPVAAHAAGTSRFHGIANLRLKECDRIAVPVAELRRFGVDCHEEGDGAIVVRGNPDGYAGGHEVDTYHDHRVAQMLALMGLRSRDGVVLRDAGTVGKSYPDFFRDLAVLGAHIDFEADLPAPSADAPDDANPEPTEPA
jgi:3-phosphoshikimate 1-carboxyvinyltransferase